MVGFTKSFTSKNVSVSCTAILLCLCFILSDVKHVKAQDEQRYQFEYPQMGTLFRIILYHPDEQVAKAAADSAFRRIDSLNYLMSDYLEDSELNKLSASSGNGNYIQVSDDLFRVISASQDLSKQTEGAFDITIGPYVQLWRTINRQDKPTLPDDAILKELSQFVGYNNIALDSSESKIALKQPNMQLDLGGIAKGYAADQALNILQSYGIKSALVDAGGDIRVGNKPSGKDGWRISIPYHTSLNELNYITLELANGAVATSGDLFQFVKIEGKRYSHIINPKTGVGLTNQRSVTVVASTGITADSYASALSVLGPCKGLLLINQKPDITAYFEFREDNTIKNVESRGFRTNIIADQ